MLMLLLWLPYSFLVWGVTLGTFTKMFPDSSHTFLSTIVTLLGPFSLPGLLLFCVMHQEVAFRIRPFTVEQRWAIFHEKYDCLGREYFDEHYS